MDCMGNVSFSPAVHVSLLEQGKGLRLSQVFLHSRTRQSLYLVFLESVLREKHPRIQGLALACSGWRVRFLRCILQLRNTASTSSGLQAGERKDETRCSQLTPKSESNILSQLECWTFSRMQLRRLHMSALSQRNNIILASQCIGNGKRAATMRIALPDTLLSAEV